MLKFDPQAVLANARHADTIDLLDRVTAYRQGMEPTALFIIEEELDRRGVTADEIAEHAACCERYCTFDRFGVAVMCSSCRRPAVATGWGWRRQREAGIVRHPLLLLTSLILPILMPRRLRYCWDHLPKAHPLRKDDDEERRERSEL